MTPAAVGNRDTTAAVFNGLGRIYMVTDPPTAAETGLEPPPPPRPSVWGKLAGLVKSAACHFHWKKSACGKLDSSNRACKIRGWPFSPKKSACGKMVSSNKACKILDGHFHRKKSACGKMDSSNRACKILDGQFHRKKSACGKLDSSNRACKVRGGQAG